MVLNFFCPEINYLAAELAVRGVLSRYVRPYANQGRSWEKSLARVPGLGRIYDRTFGRRTLPAGFAPGDIIEAGVLPDLLLAASRQLPGSAVKFLDQQLQASIRKIVGATGASCAESADAVVASYGVARQSFERASGRRILNYPNAHHRFMRRFIDEEAVLDPEFSSSLQDWGAPLPDQDPELDAECKLADVILVGSSFARDTFLSEGFSHDKLRVVQYGANTQRFTPAMERAEVSTPFRVLFVGQIGQRKGVPYLLRAYQQFQRPDTRLTLVGSHFGDPAALSAFRSLFQHVQHVPQSRLAEIYRQSDVFVFPTLIEGMGMVVLEAMASGLPVITTRNGPGDVVRDGVDGFIVPIRDADAIVEKLEHLRANPELRLEMGRNARQRALEFSWSAYRRAAADIVVNR